MSDINAEVAVLSDNVATLKKNDKEHYVSNDKRKEDIQLCTHAMTENSQIVTGLVGALEKFEERVNESIASMRDEMRDGMHDLNKKIAVMEVDGKATKDDIKSTKDDIAIIRSSKFNWSKFMTGLLTPKGMFLFVVTSVLLTTVILSVTAPEVLPAFLDFIKSAKVFK